MSTRDKTKTVSYRRNRDYTTAFVWTYELNRDVYHCYQKAREDPKLGYMKRMKVLWDELHPELCTFNEKQLRQQATFVEKKGLISTTNVTAEEGQTNVQPDIDDRQENVYIPEIVNIESSVDENTDLILIEEIRNKFIHYVNTYENQTLAQRNFKTQVIYHIKDHEWKALNYVIAEFIDNNSERMNLWLLNVIQYAAIVTILDRYNLLKERKHYARKTETPRWQKIIEEKINNLRRKISLISVVEECQKKSIQLTKHQLTIRAKLKRWYGNTKQQTLSAQLSKLKHELKVTTESLRHRKKVAERNIINKNFKHNQKEVFRQWKTKQIEVTDGPSKEEVTSFWSNIWSTQKSYNHDATWLTTLEEEYCKDSITKNYQINADVLNKVLAKMKNNGAPGNDLIRCFWVKNFTATHNTLVTEFKKIYDQGEVLPSWLVTGKTILLPKNEHTKEAKNYRPIACQNIMYKIFTGILNLFIVDHCTTNNIITIEQAGGKPGSWGCTDQLLINKMILDEVQKHRRNLFMMWFDYKKAFDSVPHDWILKALQLACIPQKIINTIENLMRMWATRLNLNDITTEIINYLSGVLQGDCMALIIFILCLNPLSFLLNKLPGYKPGPPGKRDVNKISHLFFVDDLKTYATDTMAAKAQLDLITTFTNDICMELGNDKCAYINIEKGKNVSLGEKFGINGIELNELECGEKYKYLGQDEGIGYDNVLNKDRVMKEYYRRIRKIWTSELYSQNKTIAHNIFAIPVITPTIGILNWTKDEIEQIDIKTRKILTSCGSFHINSDIDRLYAARNKGGRGLNSLVDIFIARIVSISQHLKEAEISNPYIELVVEHEKENLMRVSEQLKTSFGIDTTDTESPKNISMRIKQKMKENHVTTWIKKPQHGYLFRTRKSVGQTNEDLTNSWLKKSTFSSHVEGYICAVQEEEISTRSLKAKRSRGDENPNCRLCKNNRETIQHVVAACPKLSASMYLPMRHNKVCNVVYQNIIQKDGENKRHPIQTFYANDEIEVWWDTKINTLTRCIHNKPDIVLWQITEKKCFIIDICVCLDVNIEKNIQSKMDYYLPLAAELKRLYDSYTFEVIPIVVGATGLITSHACDALKNIGIKNVTEVMKQCQKSALLGTLKIVKSFMKM